MGRLREEQVLERIKLEMPAGCANGDVKLTVGHKILVLEEMSEREICIWMSFSCYLKL